MVNFPGRNDRRRRVLKEEARSTSGSRTTVHADVLEDAPRYSDAAGVENHPQVTDFIPRRYSTIALMGLFGASTVTVASALHYFAVPFAASRGMNSAAAFDLTARGNIAEWTAAIVLFIASGFCILTYSIRRHRIDDFRGRYRVWLGAAIACLVLSANSITGMHEVLADVLTGVTGWSALRGGAAWWITLAGLPLAWIYARTLLDVRECRIAGALMAGAAACYALSAVSYLGYGPTMNAEMQPIAVAGPLLMGHWLLFAGIVANARYVVLDAQGLIEHHREVKSKPSTSSEPAKSTASKTVQSAVAKSDAAETVSISRHTVQPVKTPADSSRWVDGSRFEREHYDGEDDEESSDGDRKLSKSDRKRLRRMKTEGRAA